MDNIYRYDNSARKRVLTWHVHGSYLYYLSQVPVDLYVPVKPGRPEGYGGRGGTYPWPDNLIEVPAEDVKNLDLDIILYQSRKNYLEDQYEILSEAQRRLPRMYLEHDPPRQSPTDTRHFVDDPAVTLVHVTHFNRLMWDNGDNPALVIDHGVMVPEDAAYKGDLPRGIVVVNDLAKRGRRLGLDVGEQVRKEVPLDLVGIAADDLGGLPSVDHQRLPYLMARYRFFFNPIRYTSLGLAICEAMMVGMPIIGLATTELSTVVENGVSGYIDTDVDALIARMKTLMVEPSEAVKLSRGARRYAKKRFSITRFSDDWCKAFDLVVERATSGATGMGVA